jgi:hypothetical protein
MLSLYRWTGKACLRSLALTAAGSHHCGHQSHLTAVVRRGQLTCLRRMARGRIREELAVVYAAAAWLAEDYFPSCYALLCFTVLMGASKCRRLE